ILFSCQVDDFELINLNGNKIDAQGHGGMGISNLYPSNSAESILNCLNLGATGTEIDLQMTADGVLVLFHDEELDWSTNLEGVIHEHTWDEIKDGVYDEVPYSSYNLVRFDRFLELTPNHSDYIFTLDTKLYTESTDYFLYLDEFSDAIVNIFNEFNLFNHVYVESQNTDFLELIQSKANNIDLYIYPQTFEEGLADAIEFNLKGLTISTFEIDEEQIQEAHDLGFFITLWDVVSEDEHIEAIHKNPDMIQSDDIQYLIDILDEQDLLN
ncbi:MAG: glycerophosphodiester phosphodiesterase, partial [Crocinitomicaceae bacterium]